MASKEQQLTNRLMALLKGTPDECSEQAQSIIELLKEEGVLHLGYGNADIDQVTSTFKDAFGTTKVSQRDRWAANRLVAKYGSQSICGIIQLLAKQQGEPYMPVINDIGQLESKWNSVLHALRRQQTASDIIDN